MSLLISLLRRLTLKPSCTSNAAVLASVPDPWNIVSDARMVSDRTNEIFQYHAAVGTFQSAGDIGSQRCVSEICFEATFFFFFEKTCTATSL